MSQAQDFSSNAGDGREGWKLRVLVKAVGVFLTFNNTNAFSHVD